MTSCRALLFVRSVRHYGGMTAIRDVERHELPAAIEARFGLPPGTLKRVRRTGRGPAFVAVTKKTILYRPTTVERWLAAVAKPERIPA